MGGRRTHPKLAKQKSKAQYLNRFSNVELEAESQNCIYSVGPAFCEHPFPFRAYEIEQNKKKLSQKTLQSAKRKPVVYLDRDGVLTKAPDFPVQSN